MPPWVPSLIHTQLYSGLQKVYCPWIACAALSVELRSAVDDLVYLSFHELNVVFGKIVCIFVCVRGVWVDVREAETREEAVTHRSYKHMLPARLGLQGRRKIAYRHSHKLAGTEGESELQGVQAGSMHLRRGWALKENNRVGISSWPCCVSVGYRGETGHVPASRLRVWIVSDSTNSRLLLWSFCKYFMSRSVILMK